MPAWVDTNIHNPPASTWVEPSTTAVNWHDMSTHNAAAFTADDSYDGQLPLGSGPFGDQIWEVIEP